MDQKKSHNITPKPKDVESRGLRPKSDRVKEQEQEQAIISPDRGLPKKKDKDGPLSVGVNFDKT